jgi:hypothetical protein
MEGDLVPLVRLRRYTTYAGPPPEPGVQPAPTTTFDATQLLGAVVDGLRGEVLVSTPPVADVRFEESAGRVVWTVCDGSPGGSGGGDPGENDETQYTLALRKRWFRVQVLLGGADNVVSCWAVGFLEERLR